MVVGFTTTYAISAYHHWCCEFESRSGRGVQHDVIKFVSDLWQVGGFLWVTPVSSTNKIDGHDITEILLKVALNTIKQTNTQRKKMYMPAPKLSSQLDSMTSKCSCGLQGQSFPSNLLQNIHMHTHMTV